MFFSRRAAAIFSLLFGVFVVSRVATLFAAGSLWFDEAFSAHIASLPWGEARALLAYEHNPWLHFLLLKLAMAVSGNADWVLRLPSVLAGAATFFALYWTSKKMFASDRSAIISVFLLIISTIHLYHQTEARMYAFVMLFAISCLCLAYAQPKHWTVFYAVAAIALAHTHLTAWIFLAVLYAIIWLDLRHRGQPTASWHIANAIVLASGLWWLIPVVMHRLGVGGASQGWFFSQHEPGYFLTHLTNFIINGEPRLPLRSLAAAFISIALASALISVEKPTWWQKVKHVFDPQSWPLNIAMRWDRPLRILVLLFALTMFGGFAMQITVTKYVLAASAPMFLLMGYGLSRLPTTIAAVVLVSLTLIAAPTHVRLLQKRHHWDDAAKQVVQLQHQYADQITLVHSFAYALPLRRYLPADATLFPFYPHQDHLNFDQAVVRHNWRPIVTTDNVGQLDELIGTHRTIILVSSTVGRGEQDPVKAYLWQSGWKLIEQYSYSGYGDPEILVWTM